MDQMGTRKRLNCRPVHVSLIERAEWAAGMFLMKGFFERRYLCAAGIPQWLSQDNKALMLLFDHAVIRVYFLFQYSGVIELTMYPFQILCREGRGVTLSPFLPAS